MPEMPVGLKARIERAGGEQPRHGRCIICKENWQGCPHTRVQTDAVCEEYKRIYLLADIYRKAT